MLARHILEDRSPRWERQNPCHGSKTENQTLMCPWQMNGNQRPSIWRGTLLWHLCKNIMAHISPLSAFSPEDHLHSYGKRKPNVKDTPSGFWEEQRGRHITAEAPGSPSFNAPQQLWGWLSSSNSTPQLAGNSINQPLPNYHWLINEEGSSQAPAVS